MTHGNNSNTVAGSKASIRRLASQDTVLAPCLDNGEAIPALIAIPHHGVGNYKRDIVAEMLFQLAGCYISDGDRVRADRYLAMMQRRTRRQCTPQQLINLEG